MPFGGTDNIYGNVRATEVEHSEFEAALWAKRMTEIPSNLQMQIDYTGAPAGQPAYVGYGARGLVSSAQGWLLHKFTYVGDNLTLRQIAYSSWDLRADAGTTYA